MWPRQVSKGAPPRWTNLALGLIVAFALLRGLSWATATPIWNGDEGAHFSYVQSIPTGHGVPVTGKDMVAPNVIKLVKDSPVSSERYLPLSPDAGKQWGIVAQQYEGYQSPV